MAPSKFYGAVLTAAVAFSGVNASRCKPSPPLSLSTTATGVGIETSVPSPTHIVETPVTLPTNIIETPSLSLTDIVKTPVASPTDVVIETPVTLPTNIIETPIPSPTNIVIIETPVPSPTEKGIETPSPTPEPTPAAPVCTPVSDDFIDVEYCSRKGDLDASANDSLDTLDNLSIEECAAATQSYYDTTGTDALSFVYTSDGRCVLYDSLAFGVSSFTPSESGADIQNDWYCYGCGNDDGGNGGVRDPEPSRPSCEFREEPDQSLICGETGAVLNGETYYSMSVSDTTPEECAYQCSILASCASFGIKTDNSCELYLAGATDLNFQSTPEYFQFYESGCFECPVVDEK